ncbi:hypothetical protein EVAR_3101_1 [Eumeta japonica]|uniref:DUF4371 domain-containing protein n=1 Tax=Eumeta variegata TaxID=151549 RepID=A0A4C1XJC4_EUMVA|nr:hypothetical protein EVAR_3101_1 [Eumeta japonica]
MSSRDRDAGRKFESGRSKRKRAIKRKQVQENLRGSFCKYIKSETYTKHLLTESDFNTDSAEKIPSTSSWVPPPSSSKNSEDDDELTTSSTPWLSHKLNKKGNAAEIEEHFIGFIAVEKTTANYIITELGQLGISLQNCRGQGYDNGANMGGEKSGVQKRIIEIYPLAYFLPCGSHSWNLILGDAASSCVQAKSFFGLLQRLYTQFAGSSQRVLSVKAVKYQLSDICDALKDLAENTTDCQLVSECHSIEKEITTYEFVISLVICGGARRRRRRRPPTASRLKGPRKQKSFAYELLKRGLAKSFAYKLLKRGLANLMSPTSTSGVTPPLVFNEYFDINIEVKCRHQ